MNRWFFGLVTAAVLSGFWGCGEVDDVKMDFSVRYVADDGHSYDINPTALVVVDANRTGVVDLDDPKDVKYRFEPGEGYGAIFLANIDDDGDRCGRGSDDDETLQSCADANQTKPVNDADLADMARIKTAPLEHAGSATYGILNVDEASREMVRLFINTDGGSGADSFEKYEIGEQQISTAQLLEGVEFAIEGLALVEDREVWSGEVELTFEIHIPEIQKVVSDRARMELAPVLLRHHLDPARVVYAAHLGQENFEFRRDLGAAADAAGVADGLQTLVTFDPWAQDYMENGYMAMPGPEGPQVIQVYFRSPNLSYPGSLEPVFAHAYQSSGRSLPPLLREAGRVVHTQLEGPGVGGQAIYDPDKGFGEIDLQGVDVVDVANYLYGQGSRNQYPEIAQHVQRVMNWDTLDSFGNTETIPPHTNSAGEYYPHGRIFRGRGAHEDVRPDPRLSGLFDAQGVQPTVWVETDWLLVAHVDETISFVESNTDRGWSLLFSDPVEARAIFEQAQQDGHGSATVFEGRGYPDYDCWNCPDIPADRSIDEILDDTRLMQDSARAAVEVDGQLETLRREVGLSEEDLVGIPHLFEDAGGGLVAYQPGMVNGISLQPGFFGPPKPHGPVIDGEDIFESAVENILGALGVEVFWIEAWDVYHVGAGEVHCGSNVERELPQIPWWLEENQ